MPSLGMSLVGMNQALDAIQTLKTGFTSESAWIVGVGAEYGAYVEIGTSKMAAQPYLFPAARRTMRQDFAKLEREANTVDELVELLALEIEAKAKQNAPVDTGFLRSSIRAFPADATS